jgi:hypothetical protein
MFIAMDGMYDCFAGEKQAEGLTGYCTFTAQKSTTNAA